MKIPLLAALTLVIALGGCASRWNPMNWAGSNSTPDTLEPEEGYAAATVDTRPLVAQVTGLTIDQAPGGVIVRATGLPATQGYWNVALLPQGPAESCTMTYRFVAVPPGRPVPAGSAAAREVTAARFLNAYQLESIRHIVVVGETNQRSVTAR